MYIYHSARAIGEDRFAADKIGLRKTLPRFSTYYCHLCDEFLQPDEVTVMPYGLKHVKYDLNSPW